MKVKITYTPLFQSDVNDTLDYICNTLKNPIAANAFLDSLEREILDRSQNPTAFAPYHGTKGRPTTYYTLRIKNYTAFYVVLGDTMEFRRLLYSRSALSAKI